MQRSEIGGIQWTVMTSREIRRSFLAYFEKHGHRIVPSSSLVPADDPTLLFTNAGMNQFKDLFLGRERRDYTRATTAQKVMRVSGKHNDLDNVGPSLRHHTFFEMLGNFSFGDYFKEEAIGLSWTMLTEVWNLPADKLHATIFVGDENVPRDEEAYRIWRQYLPADHIQALGADDNFWQMGDTGPCGRCSEIYVDRSDDPRCPESDRLVEVWNNVFMEFDRQPDGTLVPLPAPSIDTGMSLERITAVIQGTFSNYDTDLFTPILAAIGELARVHHGQTEATDISMHVIADHIRAATFLIADGVVPSNEWRGYVLRKIMRRAMRHGKRLGLAEPFLHRLVDVVVREMGTAYPELPANRDTVVQVVRGEEERFDTVLTSGLPRLEELLERAGASSSRTVPGDEVFRLYDSFGMPVDFIEDLASERQLTFDRTGFDRAMEGQRERARASNAFEQKKAAMFAFSSDDRRQAIERAGDRFEGYTTTAAEDVPILAVFDEQRAQVDRLDAGTSGFVVTERTPFYLEAGGQVSDTGTIAASGGAAGAAAADVVGIMRIGPGAPRAHHVRVLTGNLAEGDRVSLVVDATRRDAIRRNHTATHLLHAALRRVLGPHVKQAGSLVAPDRLRFDFVHSAAISRADLDAIERLVNAEVMRNAPVITEVKPTAEAIEAGAMALFGEKYGDRVRVVSIPDFSLELCGGTHCGATGDIGFFTIVSEGAVGAGVRRIEALTGEGAIAHAQASRDRLARVLEELKVAPDQAADAVVRLQTDVKRLSRELQHARVQSALGRVTTAAEQDDAEQVAGIRLIARRVNGVDRSALRDLADTLKSGLGSGVVILVTADEGKVAFVVSVTPDLTGRLRAGAIVKELAPIVGGGGGGRPDFAEAGGRDPAGIDALLAEGRRVVERMSAGA